MILCVEVLPTAIDPIESLRLVSTAADAGHHARKPFTGSDWFNLYLICKKISLTGPHFTASVSHVAEIFQGKSHAWEPL